AAVFAVQMLFGLITVSTDTNNASERSFTSDEYDYHLVLTNLNSDQYSYMMSNDYRAVRSDAEFEIIRTVRHTANGTGYYDMYFLFSGATPDDDFSTFKNRYFRTLNSIENDKFGYYLSPLLDYGSVKLRSDVSYNLLMLLLSAVSVALLTVLYSIRINHFKYEYGIYMTFGADFRKLFGTAFWEMATVSAVTFLPAVAASYVVCAAVYGSVGINVTVNLLSVLKLIPISMITASLSVLLPMLSVSRRPPVNNIIAEDNSNLVISPRRSFEMLNRKFRAYEMFSLWRFRKYCVGLLFSAVSFAAVFVTAVYISGMYNTRLSVPSPEFSLVIEHDPDGFSYDDMMKTELLSLGGITEIEKESSVEAVDLRSHVVFDSEDTAFMSNFVVSESEDDGQTFRITNHALYSVCDADIIESLGKYEYSGDLSSAINSKHTVIISDSFDNTKKLNISPGDKIRVAIFKSMKAPIKDYETGNALLKKQLKYNNYEYAEFTVGAVIHNNPTGNSMPIWFCADDYQTITDTGDNLGITADFGNVYLYTDPSLSTEELDNLEHKIFDWASGYGNINVNRTRSAGQMKIERAKCGGQFILCSAALILLFTPLVWFFSQILWYAKRDGEFIMLKNMGALESEIRRIRIIDGISFALTGSALFSALSFSAVFATGKIFNTFALSFGYLSGIVRYSYDIPLYAFAAGIAITAVCGITAPLVPYLKVNFRRKPRRKSAQRGV
ncbi:MAG: FtsX-like permease family protein, partial [Firmicutes bacterium]|nr:FtsX-like permease family protein [Bacillota bacterium]